MELVPAFSRGGDEGDTKTASPIPEEIREARSSVVLIGPQLRIGEHVDWHEEESVSQPLISPGQSIVRIIGCERKCAVVPHRGADSDDADRQQYAGRYNLALDQL